MFRLLKIIFFFRKMGSQRQRQIPHQRPIRMPRRPSSLIPPSSFPVSVSVTFSAPLLHIYLFFYTPVTAPNRPTAPARSACPTRQMRLIKVVVKDDFRNYNCCSNKNSRRNMMKKILCVAEKPSAAMKITEICPEVNFLPEI